MKNYKQKLQSDQRETKQIRIDAGYVRLLKIEASKRNTTVKELVEGCLAELLEVKNEN